LDNFGRAAESLPAGTAGETAVTEQYAAVRVGLEGVLRRYGIDEKDCVGRPFDPLVHEAIVSEHSSEVRAPPHHLSLTLLTPPSLPAY